MTVPEKISADYTLRPRLPSGSSFSLSAVANPPGVARQGGG